VPRSNCGLLTDRERSCGIILVKKGVSAQRRRFTMGHELGHFLMPSHIPDEEGRFLCSQSDIALLKPKEGDRRAKMEVEANRFSSLILMPPPASSSRSEAPDGPSARSKVTNNKGRGGVGW
jgi:Zn-dependent peptidase ImmA (M78 family)